MRRIGLLLAISLCALTATLHGQEQQPRFGHAPSAAELRRWQTAVLPDGTGLPPGSGTATQGKKIYADQCSGCHGVRAQGNRPLGGPLVGGFGTLQSSNPMLTVGSYWPYATSVWDYIHRAMPYPQPGTLSADQTYALTAFLLYSNGVIKKNDVMNAQMLPNVRMPNRDGFVSDPRPDVPAPAKQSHGT